MREKQNTVPKEKPFLVCKLWISLFLSHEATIPRKVKHTSSPVMCTTSAALEYYFTKFICHLK